MRRIISAFLLILASAVTASAQGLSPSVWQSVRAGLLKVLSVDAAGNFTGVFITSPTGPCPRVPYNLVGRVRGSLVVFQTSRNWTSDCNVTTNWTGVLLARPPSSQGELLHLLAVGCAAQRLSSASEVSRTHR